MKKYNLKERIMMNPAQCAVACGCCGAMDVPVTGATGELEEAAEALGILALTLSHCRLSLFHCLHRHWRPAALKAAA
jgi:hypothetical protein